jgi:hypothetical protein
VKEKKRKNSGSLKNMSGSKDRGRKAYMLTDQLRKTLRPLKVDRTTYLIYALLYIPVGFFMNAMGQFFQIGEYAYWWQVFTCYGLYLIPASLLVRHRSYFDQYMSGLLIIAILELPAYSLGTSIAHPNSILDQYLTPRNYTLFMTLFFAGFIPLGNWAATKTRRWSGK